MPKKTFRDGSYYRHVIFGKRTVKQGEAAAVWDRNGTRKVTIGPKRVRLFFAHVRFLSRQVAEGHEYLRIAYRDGRTEHRRGPCAVFVDPCVHDNVEVKRAFKLAANEALVVYREHGPDGEGNGERPPSKAASKAAAAAQADAAITSTGSTSPQEDAQASNVIGEPANVLRRIVHGPAVYVPRHDEWIHTFSWSASGVRELRRSSTPDAEPSAAQSGKVQSNALQFQTLRCTPDQIYVTVNDVRTKDDTQLSVHLMVFYELSDVQKMLDSSNDPIGDLINAVSADVMGFGAANTYESLLEKTEMLQHLETFPTVRTRMAAIGYSLHNVVYRGFSTSKKLQQMHDEAVAKRTELRLSSETARVEQAEAAMLLRSREERSQGEQELAAASAKHEIELARLKAEQQREERDADHTQALRHEQEKADAALAIRKQEHDEELRRAAALKQLDVDLTKLLCVTADHAPGTHLRIDSATPTAVHLAAPPPTLK